MKSEIVFKTPDDNNHYYFGYYDKSPLSDDGKKLLALKVSFIDHIPNKYDEAIIGYFDIDSGDFRELTKTKTFNWQQGCMLQWLGPKYNSHIIYNDIHDGEFVSIIYDLNTEKKQILPIAVYSVSPNGDKAICIDNERHHWCRRGYSYDGISNKDKNKNIVQGDGIFLLDIEKSSIKKIISIEQMNLIKPLKTMFEGENYLEHLMVSPCGKKFTFLHRWKNFGGIYARLYVADIDGRNIELINDSGRMSHFSWRNSNQIIGWGGLSNPINSLRKYKNIAKYFIKPLMPIYRWIASGDSVEGNSIISRAASGDSYILFDITTKKNNRVLADKLNKDGHPSICPSNRNLMITDTYPGTGHVCELILANISTSETFVLDRLKSIDDYDNSPLRCDLHPKWSFCGKYVCIDTMNEGRRGMYLYRIEDVN